MPARSLAMPKIFSRSVSAPLVVPPSTLRVYAPRILSLSLSLGSRSCARSRSALSISVRLFLYIYPRATTRLSACALFGYTRRSREHLIPSPSVSALSLSPSPPQRLLRAVFRVSVEPATKGPAAPVLSQRRRVTRAHVYCAAFLYPTTRPISRSFSVPLRGYYARMRACSFSVERRGKESVRRTKPAPDGGPSGLRFEQLDTEHMAPLLKPTLASRRPSVLFLPFFPGPSLALPFGLLHFCSVASRCPFRSAVPRSTIHGFVLTHIDARAAIVHRDSIRNESVSTGKWLRGLVAQSLADRPVNPLVRDFLRGFWGRIGSE